LDSSPREYVQHGHEVTRILSRLNKGDEAAVEELWPVIRQELGRLASKKLQNERQDQDMQTTILAHDAFMNVVLGSDRLSIINRDHFYALTAIMMDRVLYKAAKKRNALKRGGTAQKHLKLNSDLPDSTAQNPLEELILSESQQHILEALHQLASDKGEIWRDVLIMRRVLGLPVEDTARILGLSPATVKRYTQHGLAFLYGLLEG